MFLKALTIKGFKSFADNTTLEFEPGVTVVVGPNGSGKSNVVDAIGWVLGAQAPSAVRSQKMDDVIFAGTTKRPALGRAEVSITIDNAAGLLPIEFPEVTVTRTLWRSGDSEYAINNVPCRLLDVQELFSDTGVGRQQHVIVGQGQIDAVLNARPEDRRTVIEEAAGVLKHRRRKERSERRLSSTEGNLVRLQDLQREVRRQLRPLEKQADAARRHGSVVEELRALQVYAAGRELATLRRRLAESTAARSEAAGEDRVVRRRLAELDAIVLAAEAELTALGGDDLGDSLAQVEALREKARGLTALLNERLKGVEREREAFIDQGVIASLESDAARLEGELRDLDGTEAQLAPEVEELAREETSLDEARLTFEETWAGGVPSPSGKASEVRGELTALRKTHERGVAELDRARQRLARLSERVDRLDAEAERLAGEIARAEAAEGDLVVAHETAEQALAAAEEAAEAAVEGAEEIAESAVAAVEAAAEQAVAAAEEAAAQAVAGAEEACAAVEDEVAGSEEADRAAQAERARWDAKVEALTLALDDARTRAGVERLAGVDGVVGTLLDLVEIDPGWEPAFEAACGEALAAVVVGSVDAGREAVRILAQGDLPGAVLALEATRPTRDADLPAAGERVRTHVHPRRPEVAPLLDALVGAAVVVDRGWAGAIDTAVAHPDAVVVTREGGRFAAEGWRAVTATTGATGAALDEATAKARAARAVAEETRAAVDAATARRREAVAARDAARRDADAARDAARKEATAARDAARRDADAARESARRATDAARDQARHDVESARRRLEDLRRGVAADTDKRARAAADAEEARAEASSVAGQLEEATERITREHSRVAELETLLPALEAEETQLSEKRDAMAAARRQLEQRTAALSGRRQDIEVRRAAVGERRTFLEQRLGEVRERLARTSEAWQEAKERRVELDRHEAVLRGLSRFVDERTAVVRDQHADLTERRRRQTDAHREISLRLDGARKQRIESEATLEKARERGRRAELDEAEVRLRLEQATENCRTQLDIEPHAAINAPVPELPDGVPAAARIRELERDLKLMGPINPLALEEFEQIQERHAFLQEQLDDVKASRRELSKVIRAVDEEIVRVFAAAYADVSENFEQLFTMLFPGGRGRLRLTNPDDLLNCGIEIEAKPSGKNVKKLSLLSGGERSLTALAFLFAVFRSRPSPFYVMDEVEAALDDVNLHRFLDLVAEFRLEAQLVIVSHQKRTMEAADCLYGVTMQPAGSSKVVSEKVTAGA
jgi:chromosome segregation protein